jgi:hypothetical protein
MMPLGLAGSRAMRSDHLSTTPADNINTGYKQNGENTGLLSTNLEEGQGNFFSESNGGSPPKQ